VASQIFFPKDVISQLLVIGASVVPDVPVASMLILDKLKGKQPLKEQTKNFIKVNGIFHSLIIWLISGLCWPVFVGGYSHLLLDRISHSGEKFREVDPSMLWPLPWKLRGIFEYRKKHGELFSPVDIMLTILCILLFTWLRFSFPK